MRLIHTFPMRSGHDPEILRLARPGENYPAIRDAAAALLTAGHLHDVLAASYDRRIVDEYQDCSIAQHVIVACVAQVLSTCVLGDPLQAIFAFNGQKLVHWTSGVCRQFPPAGELATPHRWINAGTRPFGEWLLDARRHLLAAASVDLRSAPPGNVSWIPLDGTANQARRLEA